MKNPIENCARRLYMFEGSLPRPTVRTTELARGHQDMYIQKSTTAYESDHWSTKRQPIQIATCDETLATKSFKKPFDVYHALFPQIQRFLKSLYLLLTPLNDDCRTHFIIFSGDLDAKLVCPLCVVNIIFAS